MVGYMNKAHKSSIYLFKNKNILTLTILSLSESLRISAGI